MSSTDTLTNISQCKSVNASRCIPINIRHTGTNIIYRYNINQCIHVVSNNPYVLTIDVVRADIDAYTFMDSTRLAYVDMPMVGYIRYLSFTRSGLRQLIIDSPVLKDIGETAFSECDKLRSVYISSPIVRITRQLLSQCPKLLCVTLPDTAVMIFGDAFHDCKALEYVNVESIRQYHGKPFRNCPALKPLYMRDVQYIDVSAIPYNTVLPNRCIYIDNVDGVAVEDNLEDEGVEDHIIAHINVDRPPIKYPGRTPYKRIDDANIISTNASTTGDDTLMTIRDGNIPKSAYINSKIHELHCENVDVIGIRAFSMSEHLHSVYIKSSRPVYIRDYAFYRCCALTTVHIDAPYINIGLNVFDRCDKLKGYTITGTLVQTH